MSCFKPLKAILEPGKTTANGKKVIKVIGQEDPVPPGGLVMSVPCGQCIGCRLSKSREWATRMVHEASLHFDNVFITLTYNPENLPPDGGLIRSDFQKFMKRLRKYAEPRRFKFYHCGEYGDESNRPHYHAILFGYNFNDWVYLFDSPSGQPIYTSPTLEKIWGLGFVTVGEVSFESCAYVARYVMKKINGLGLNEINEETGLKPYERYNSFTGELTEVLPEYSTMSRGGRTGHGIGHDWISTYTRDCYPKDFTTIRGVRIKPPKYYDRYIEEIDKEMYDDIKAKRELSLTEQFSELSRSRLDQKEAVKLAQHNQLKRLL